VTVRVGTFPHANTRKLGSAAYTAKQVVHGFVFRGTSVGFHRHGKTGTNTHKRSKGTTAGLQLMLGPPILILATSTASETRRPGWEYARPFLVATAPRWVNPIEEVFSTR
jgi:hypothetical protein